MTNREEYLNIDGTSDKVRFYVFTDGFIEVMEKSTGNFLFRGFEDDYEKWLESEVTHEYVPYTS